MCSFEPPIPIDAKLYPLLVRFGLSTGYQVKTNEPRTLVYAIRCVDPIRIREAQESGHPTSLSQKEATDLAESLEGIRADKGEGAYKPDYDPPIRVDADMYERHLRPDMNAAGYDVHVQPVGRDYYIRRVYGTVESQTKGDVVCRSEVTGILRDLEYERRMSTYLVACNLVISGQARLATWLDGVDTMEKAVQVLEGERARYFPKDDWRIYTNVTAIARTLKGDFPDDVVKPEGWLWLRVWHPGKGRAHYWSGGTFDDLDDVRVAIADEEALDIYAVTAVYACVRVQHEAPADTLYKMLYWSTRQKGDIDEPYGEVVVSEPAAIKKAALSIMRTKDIYRFETWKRLACVQREVVVEEYHGNEAHLLLNNARVEREE